jgi:F-type H+-transporting ATPase subunit b
MLIDWFTVSAQAVNFLVLVWLLKRFLYKPIVDAIEERQKRITAQLQEAAAEKKAAEKERDDFQHKNEEFARQRDGLLKNATDEAKVERQRLLDEARKESEALRTRLQEALRNERDSLSREFTSRAQQEVFAIARQALSSLATESLEERMTEVFIRRLRELNGEEKGRLASFLQHPHRPALVRSAFELPQEQRGAIERAVRETLSEQTQVQFETSPALVSGIELTTNGHKVAWSIDDYLVSMEKRAGDLPKPTHANDS